MERENNHKWILNGLRGLLCLFFACLVIACSSGPEPDATDSHGNPIRLSDYRGKWVIVNYWATWCKPCKTEMPILNTLHQQYKNKLVILGVSYDKLPNDTLNKIAQKESIKYPLLSSFPLRILGVSHVTIVPISFVFNPQGELVRTLKGPQTAAQLRQALDIKA